MRARILFISLASFWVVMNVLLWRAEYGPRRTVGGSVPVELVWRRMLTAPDSSSLSVFHHGQKIGFCHWTTSVGEELSRLKADEGPPEGMVRRVTGYRLELEGNIAWEEFTNRVRFDCSLKLSTNQLWQEFTLRFNLRPTVCEIHSVADEQFLRLLVDDGVDGFERRIKFSELQSPETLLPELAGPLAFGALAGLRGLGGGRSVASLSDAIRCEARNDTIKLGPAQVRAYRLQARWLDRFQAVLWVSRVGEILRAELPDELVLENDQLANF